MVKPEYGGSGTGSKSFEAVTLEVIFRAGYVLREGLQVGEARHVLCKENDKFFFLSE